MKESSQPPRRIRRLVLVAAVMSIGLSALPSQAADFELSLQAGAALPFYSQSFGFDPNDVLPPDIPVTATGGFDLEASGGLSLAGTFVWRFKERWGLEGRIDSAE